MRFSALVAAAVALCLLPGVSRADFVSSNRNDAQPYIKAALATPMPALGEKALKKAPKDSLSLGLAMLAGRGDGVQTDTTNDAAKLQALETRIAPLIGDYLKAHPGANAMEVNWPLALQVTPDEAAFVEHYLQVHSADYWLEQAAYAIDGREEFLPRRPTLNVEANAQARMTDVIVPEKAIDTNVVVAAAHCVVAVRRAAGVDYQPWATLPLSIRLLQTLPRKDMQARVDVDIANTTARPKYPVGAAACGTDDQFKAYVALLKPAS